MRRCIQCNAKLGKSDIFCLKCSTPVLTEDDVTLMLNAGEEGRPDYELHKVESSKFSRFISKYSRLAVIFVTAVVCLSLIATGVYFLFRESPSPTYDTESPVLSSDINDEDQAQIESDFETTFAVSQEVSSIPVSSGGRIQTEFHTMVNDSILLTAQIVPDGAGSDITWSSSDTDVLEVLPVDQRGQEAFITGVSAGVADVIVSAGGFEARYVVFVDDLPKHLQLEHAIENTDSTIWLVVTWVSGENTGREYVFERDEKNLEWSLEVISVINTVEPVFGRDENAFTILFKDSTRIYYLFPDGTGHYMNPDGSDDDEFTWIWGTLRIEPEG